MSSGILISRREKIRLGKISLSEPSQVNLNNFKRYRNVYNRTIRAAKKLYYESELLKNQTNLKKSWQLLKSAINNKKIKSSLISKIVSNDKTTTNPKEMAALFNEFFTSMPSKIVQDLHMADQESCPDFAKDFFTPLEDEAVPPFKFSSTPISTEEILAATKDLLPKTSLDHNGVSLFFIKQFINHLLTPL
jgi:hypothetical protein